MSPRRDEEDGDELAARTGIEDKGRAVGMPFNRTQNRQALQLHRWQWVRANDDEQKAEHASTFVSPLKAVMHLAGMAVVMRRCGDADVVSCSSRRIALWIARSAREY